jgi:hypothetical protein
LGRALARAYAERSALVFVGTRGASAPRDAAGIERVHWDPLHEPAPPVVASCDTVFNLIGENIGASRWSDSKKRALRESRVVSTRRLTAAFGAQNRVFVCASAISAYAGDGSTCVEAVANTSTANASFIHAMTREWEAAALEAAGRVRTILLRVGAVLGEAGMLDGMLPLFRLRVARHLGDPKLPIPWIDARDAVRLAVFLAEHSSARGPYNVVSPSLARFAELSEVVGSELGVRSRLGLPAWAVRLALGNDAAQLVLARYDARPVRALELGFRFDHSDLRESVRFALKARARGQAPAPDPTGAAASRG